MSYQTLYRMLKGERISGASLRKLAEALASFPIIPGIDDLLGPPPDGTATPVGADKE